ncbi:hypothetical protein CDAR_439071 [Caerostris darwini]|uniref:Ycf15 n=1 Tax=Caerostris darwini TaxID=1538125 RepID=A0AAV4MHK8_9ARAC|nr:hypothetical protein CDAR_439071 [Caerostris darwini]
MKILLPNEKVVLCQGKLSIDMFLWIPEDEWKILNPDVLSEALKQDNQSHIALFFGVYHSAISRLWKQFITRQIVVQRSFGMSSKGYDPR